jgi:hypothetical protein
MWLTVEGGILVFLLLAGKVAVWGESASMLDRPFGILTSLSESLELIVWVFTVIRVPGGFVELVIQVALNTKTDWCFRYSSSILMVALTSQVSFP